MQAETQAPPFLWQGVKLVDLAHREESPTSLSYRKSNQCYKTPRISYTGSPLCLKFAGCYVTYAIELILYASLNRHIMAPDVAGSCLDSSP